MTEISRRIGVTQQTSYPWWKEYVADSYECHGWQRKITDDSEQALAANSFGPIWDDGDEAILERSCAGPIPDIPATIKETFLLQGKKAGHL